MEFIVAENEYFYILNMYHAQFMSFLFKIGFYIRLILNFDSGNSSFSKNSKSRMDESHIWG